MTYQLLALATLAYADLAVPPDLSDHVVSWDAAHCPAEADALALAVGDRDLEAVQLLALRQGVQQRLASWHAAGRLDEACVTAVRGLDMVLRREADLALQRQGASSSWLSVDPTFGPHALRSGDVLVSRGDKLSSAGIASIGVHPSHFSHNAVVYVDDAGQAWTIEAYLEKGAIVQPLEAFLGHGVARVAVARFHDEALAAEAAQAAYTRVVDGPAIGYDAGFTDDRSTLYCSEIAGWAFSLVGGPDDLPLHPTPFDHEGRGAMFAAMGVTVPHLSAPADVLFDPRFELVAEWRDMGLLEELRRQDAVVAGLFGWIEQGYELQPRFAQRATVDVGLALRRTPGFGALLADQVHPDADRQFLVASLTLQTAGLVVFDELERRTGGRVLTDAQLADEVQTIWRRDAQRAHRQPRKARLHRLLQARELRTGG